jgi:hypothetical protein
LSTIDQGQAPSNGGIGSFPIDPSAEPQQNTPAVVTGQDETEFYRRTGAQERLRHNEQNLGYLGKFFGANSSAPTNIAGLVVICSLIILVISLFFTGNSEMAEARKWLIGLITSALSFIFGAASKH